MTRVTDWLTTHHRAALTSVAALLVMLLGTGLVVSHHATHTPSGSPAVSPTGESSRPADHVATGPASAAGHRQRPQRLSGADRSAVAGDLAWLRSMAPITAKKAKTHNGGPVIGRADRSQPDLYAAAFARVLLTQDYASPRSDLLDWVQGQSAATTEPSVVGLVPANLRSRLAVASVQDGFDGPGPVPTRGVWDALAARHGHTTVRIQHVSEPVNWSAALAAGQISDPGITARQVDARLTLHTRAGGHRHTSVASVALTINLEGPPVRRGYGLVLLVDYTTRAVSS